MQLPLNRYEVSINDLAILALHYRMMHLHLEFHEFIEGRYDNALKLGMLQLYKDKCSFLDAERISEVKRVSEHRVAEEKGDLWQVFAYACGSDMLNAQPDMSVVMKIAGAILDNYPKDEIVDEYSLEFYHALKSASEDEYQKLSERMENLIADELSPSENGE